MAEENRPDFEDVYKEHFRFVYRVMRRSVGMCDQGEVEDLVQDVFIIVYRKLSGFDGRCKISTWLYGICWRVASQYRRKRKVERLLRHGSHDDIIIPSQENAEQALNKLQLRGLFYRSLDKLGSKKRQVIILYELEGYSGSEIAEIVGCKEATVWSRLHHARKDFQRLLGRSEFGKMAGLACLAGTI